jgi:hypothetical protein
MEDIKTNEVKNLQINEEIKEYEIKNCQIKEEEVKFPQIIEKQIKGQGKSFISTKEIQVEISINFSFSHPSNFLNVLSIFKGVKRP